MPVQWEKASPLVRERYLDKYPQYKKKMSGPESLTMSRINIHKVLDFILSMNKDKCKNYNPDDLILQDDLKYGADEYYQNEAKMAVRLANFISAFLQVNKNSTINLS